MATKVKNPTSKSTSRVDDLRLRRLALGLKRRELYVHDQDWPQVQSLSSQLQSRREQDAGLLSKLDDPDEIQNPKTHETQKNE